MKRYRWSLLIAGIVTAICAGTILMRSFKATRAPEIEVQAVAQAKDLAAGLLTAKNQLTSISTATKSLDVSDYSKSVQNILVKYDQLADSIPAAGLDPRVLGTAKDLATKLHEDTDQLAAIATSTKSMDMSRFTKAMQDTLSKFDVLADAKGRSPLPEVGNTAPAIPRGTSQSRELLLNFQQQAETINQAQQTISRSAISLRDQVGALQVTIDQLAAPMEKPMLQAQEVASAIRNNTQQGRESLSHLQQQAETIKQTQEAVSRSATSAGEQIGKLQEAVDQLIAQFAKLPSTQNESSPTTTLTALIGLLGTISGILLAWRADAREKLRLLIELEKLHAR
jgi:archaellum component FlaC